MSFGFVNNVRWHKGKDPNFFFPQNTLRVPKPIKERIFKK